MGSTSVSLLSVVSVSRSKQARTKGNVLPQAQIRLQEAWPETQATAEEMRLCANGGKGLGLPNDPNSRRSLW